MRSFFYDIRRYFKIPSFSVHQGSVFKQLQGALRYVATLLEIISLLEVLHYRVQDEHLMG